MNTPLLLTGREHDLGGGLMVRRMLPAMQRQSVGPFVFFDHFGPLTELPEYQHDVRPHPHIGLATVTYLFDGAMVHRDSLGSVQRIEPGAINWMTAGRGIVHSERRPDDLRQRPYLSHGLQLWAALPQAHEEDEPSFVHTPAAVIPELTMGAARVRVLIGEAFGRRSPVATFSNTLYLDVQFSEEGALELPPLAQELAVYAVDGDLRLGAGLLSARTLAVLQGTVPVRIEAPGAGRLVVIGGEPLDGRRFIWWNYVSSRKERIAQAAQDWADQTMGQVPGETEFIPLPEKRFVV
ncbi:MAG: Pirin [Burkholderiaceae bacterium]|jgi:redox-sensitive bicupin YhaK (pirin superfamily)|nr:MAG: Pirin [Burkholderiaceae bacterium]